MVVYWGMLIWVFLLGVSKPAKCNPLKSNDAMAYQATWREALILMFPVIFFAIFRVAPIDTASYIRGFNNMPDDMLYFNEWLQTRKGSMFYYGLQMLFKCYISDFATAWFGLIAIVQGLLVARFLQKYSPNVTMSVFIFIGSTLFTWMYNGIRQFIAVVVVLAMTEYVLTKRWYIYLPIALLLGGFTPILELFGVENIPWFLDGIHQSALLLVPILFIVPGKAWNWRVLLFTVLFFAVIAVGGMDSLLETATETVDEYKDDLQYVEEGSGASPLRAIVALVPVVMAWFKRKEIRAMGEACPPIIHMSINMSLFTLAMYIASTITSGIYIGRLPIYTELYNLILIPWLILHLYKREKKLLSQVMYGAYLLWFVYQMHVAWAGLSYASDVLHLYFWGGTL